MKRTVLLALLAAACTGSGAPSEGNLREALAQGGNRGAAQAKLLECKRSPDRPGFVCDYRAPACNRFTGTCGAERPFTGRFLYAAGKWQQVEDLTTRAPTDPATVPLPGVVLATPTAGATPATAPPITAAPAPPVAAPSPTPPVEQPDLSRNERQRIARWRESDAQCRDGDEDACADRDDRGSELQGRGLCYGPPGAFGYDRAWRRCEGQAR